MSRSQKDQLEQACIVTQRYWRSKKRLQLHRMLGLLHNQWSPEADFNWDAQNPETFEKLSIKTKIPNTRLQKIVYELAAHNQVIQPKVYHWTNVSNLQSIIQSGYLYGNQILRKLGIKFDGNAMQYGDVTNGDGQVICLCPAAADPLVFINNSGSIKDNLVRLTINLSKLDKVHGKYNQFFKTHDFCATPFKYKIMITESLAMQVSKRLGGGCDVTFVLNDKPYKVFLSTKESMFYGDLSQINLFCLAKMFDLINKTTPEFKDSFHAYIDTLSDADVKKILVSFAQSLTFCAEYNFNAALKLSDHAISEIYFLDAQKLCSLENLSTAEYKKTLTQIASDASSLPADNIAEQKAALYQKIGATFRVHYQTSIVDKKSELFDTETYVETRAEQDSLLNRK